MICKKLEDGKTHGDPSVICRVYHDYCPRTKAAARIGPECWNIDYEKECVNRFKE